MNIDEDSYPKSLKNIYAPPKVLYCLGNIEEKDNNAIAIVGTRRCTIYGQNIAFNLAKELARNNITVVSGLASGIDTSAHKGALAVGGRTIAVLAGGLDNIFPPENSDLAKDIISCGAVVSENPPGTRSLAFLFPKRNRIISGLSKGVVVIEAGYKSGAMITAKLALEQGRDVFAVPGDINSDLSKGPHWLIKEGAKLVESVDDILEEYNIQKQEQITADYSQLSFEENNIIQNISNDPMLIDDIAENFGLNIAQVSILLTSLELKGLIRQLPGKRFILN